MLQRPVGNRAVLPLSPVPFLEFSPFVSVDVLMFCLVELNEVLGVFLKGGALEGLIMCGFIHGLQTQMLREAFHCVT